MLPLLSSLFPTCGQPSLRQQVWAMSARGLMMSALAGALLSLPSAVLANPSDRESDRVIAAHSESHLPVVLGVAQADTNASNWTTLTARLDQVGVDYRVVEWDRLRRVDDLDSINVLFLPGVTTVTPRQLQVLEDWVERGGRIIVSGSFGTSSSRSVQEELRSLLGAYWAFALPQPAHLHLNSRRLPIDEPGDDRAIAGGVIIPIGVQSYTVASWQAVEAPSERRSREATQVTAGAPAVVMTEQAAFLGWEWGASTTVGTDADFDVQWLQAVLAGGDRPQSAADTTVPAASSLLSNHINRLAPANSEDLESIRRSPQTTTRPQRQPQAPATAQAASPAAATSPPPNSQARALPLSPASDDEFLDPTEQIAPAGLNVQRNAAPISILESISMEQELENLIGRFESALLAASVLGEDADGLATTEAILVASADESLSLDPGLQDQFAQSQDANAYARIRNHPVLVEAREILEAFPNLVLQREYQEARQQWLEARQLLWENFPTDRPIAQPEVRAIWLDRGTIVEAGSRQGLAVIFDRLAEVGINTVFVETVNAGYPIYPSQVAPQQNPLIRNWDPLAAAVELAHERGMEAHAWVWVFAVGNERHNVIAGLPASYPGPILAAHPEWANYDHRGQRIPAGQNKPFLDPANPQARQFLLDLYEEIVTNYEVDGLQLDYIRYPFQNPGARSTYGYGAAARRQFQQATGVDPITISPSDRQLWQAWTEFRTEQVNSFVAEVADRMRTLRPDIVLSAAVFAMSEHERIQKLQQHWEAWSRAGDIDMIVTMSYALDTNRFQRLTSPWLLEADLGSTMVVPGIQLLNLPEAAAFDQIQLLRDTPAEGYALFAVEHLSDDLSSIFRRTQGANQTPLAPVPFRDPFQTAAVRFETLNREWNFVLESGEMWIRDAQRNEWQTQAQNLQDSLNQLADRPSPETIDQAIANLNQFRDHFSDWMYLQSLSHGYRVQIWEHRLAMIDNLIRYGRDRQHFTSTR